MSKYIKRSELTAEQLGKIGFSSEEIKKIKTNELISIPSIDNNIISLSIKKKNNDRIKYPIHWENKLKIKYLRYVARDRNRNMSIALTPIEFEKLILGNCVFCGSTDQITIDRRDSKIGYEINNCQSCCNTCNIMKSYISEYTFLEQIAKIYHYQTSPPPPSLGG